MANLSFTFESEDDSRKFKSLIYDLAINFPDHGGLQSKYGHDYSDFLITVLDDATAAKAMIPDEERMVTLFVSGQKMISGPLPEMQRKFEQEVGSHTATVELRERRGGDWATIRKRTTKQ